MENEEKSIRFLNGCIRGGGINKLNFRQKSLSTLVKLKHDIKKHLNCLNFN